VAVVELRLEGEGAGNPRVLAGELERMTCLRPASTTDFVGRAAVIDASGRLCRFWKFELHSTQAVLMIRQHEGFRDGLDGVAEPDVGAAVRSTRSSAQ